MSKWRSVYFWFFKRHSRRIFSTLALQVATASSKEAEALWAETTPCGALAAARLAYRSSGRSRKILPGLRVTNLRQKPSIVFCGFCFFSARQARSAVGVFLDELEAPASDIFRGALMAGDSNIVSVAESQFLRAPLPRRHGRASRGATFFFSALPHNKAEWRAKRLYCTNEPRGRRTGSCLSCVDDPPCDVSIRAVRRPVRRASRYRSLSPYGIGIAAVVV